MHYSTSSKLCTQTLLQFGGSIKAHDHLGAQSIHLAGFFCCTGSIEEILKLEPSLIDSLDTDQNTLLHYVANNNQLQLKTSIYCVEFIITKKRELLDAQNKNGSSAIHIAASIGNITFLESILQNITKLELLYYFNLKDHQGRTPLHISAMWGHSDVFLFLCSNGIDYKTLDHHHHTALHLAVLKNQKEFLQQILENSSNDLDLNSLVDLHGRTPFFYACSLGFESIIDVLLLYDIDFENVVDVFGNNALHLSVDSDRVVSIRLLMDEEPNDISKFINKQNQFGISPLHLASAKNHSSCLQELLSHYHDHCTINLVDHWGRSPLHYAAYYGHLSCLHLLIDHHADLHLHDKSGNSPLFYASFHAHLPCISLFLQNHAKILDINSGGRTALHASAWFGSVRACEILLESGNSSLLDKPCNNGRTCLHRAAVKNHLRLLDFLLSKSADINFPDSNGATPLMLAAYHQKLDVVKFLLEKNANSQSKDELDRSVSSYAKRGAKTKKDNSNLDLILSLLNSNSNP